MNIRLRGLTGLTINYTLLIVFGVVFAHGVEYLLNTTVDKMLLIGTIVVINTITIRHMRCYWKDLVLGERKTYFTDRPGFTNEIIESPKVKIEKHSDLKRNLLDD